MKNSILILLVSVLSLGKVYAQISDADAKINYQHIEDAYNSRNFTAAADQSFDLITKMKSVTPKVGYTYLKSNYKAYTELAGQQQPVADYKHFKSIYDFCDEVFKVIDKATYPADKYEELLTIQKYFKSKTDEYSAQKDRTPKDAVDFLNECYKKFPKTPFNDSKIIKIERELSLNATYLCLISKAIFHDGYQGSSFYYTQGGITYLNLGQLWLNMIYVDDDLGSTKTELTTGEPKYEGQEKYLAGYIKYSVNEEHVAAKDILKSEKNALKIFDKIILVPPSLAFDFAHNKSDKLMEVFDTIVNKPKVYDFIDANFDVNAAEFKAGNYKKRIMDAYKFLLDSFPKAKPAEAEQKKGKF